MEKRVRRKLNNAGMSLVEIVVVVLILGILSAGAVVGLSYINQADSSSAAEQIASLLDRTRVTRLTVAEKNADDDAVEIKLILSKEDKKYYATIVQQVDTSQTELDKVELGGNGITITVHNGVSSVVIDGSATCEFTFQKSNGAYTSDYDKITVSGNDTCIVWMVKATGRSYIEYQ